MDSIIQSIREWLNACPFLGFIAGGIHVDWLDVNPTSHGIYPVGEVLLPEYDDLCGNRTWQYNAVIQISGLTAEDVNRIENSGQMEKFHQWINGFSRGGFELPAGCRFDSVTAGNGLLEEVDEDQRKGIYRIQINLVYERVV